MPLRTDVAAAEDAPAIAALRRAAAEHLTERFGAGHWSLTASDRSVLAALKTSRLLVVRDGGQIVATLRLATKKPWAIDRRYFVQVERPLYLTDMAVSPARQRQGIGRALLAAATDVARAWPSQAIRLDAYDADAGAGPFYEKCGFHEVGRVVYRETPLIYFERLL